MLTQEQIASYHEKGYLGVEGVLAPGEVAALRQVTDEFVEQSRAATERRHRIRLGAGARA